MKKKIQINKEQKKTKTTTTKEKKRKTHQKLFSFPWFILFIYFFIYFLDEKP